jgi:hypothetical protein
VPIEINLDLLHARCATPMQALCSPAPLDGPAATNTLQLTEKSEGSRWHRNCFAPMGTQLCAGAIAFPRRMLILQRAHLAGGAMGRSHGSFHVVHALVKTGPRRIHPVEAIVVARFVRLLRTPRVAAPDLGSTSRFSMRAAVQSSHPLRLDEVLRSGMESRGDQVGKAPPAVANHRALRHQRNLPCDD